MNGWNSSLVSFWEGLFSGAMLVSGRVTSYSCMSRCTELHKSVILLQPEFHVSHGFGFATSFHFVWEGPGTWLHFCSQNLSQSHTFIHIYLQSPKTIPKPTRGPESPYSGEISLSYPSKMPRSSGWWAYHYFWLPSWFNMTVTESTPPT